ncbi:MAG: neocarzinostatin apoprotein domain-containing protein, partial [Acidimicrobiales bacterium]
MKRIMTSLATVAIVFATVSLAGTIGASATTTAVPSITLSPSIGVTNGQTVTITGTGFSPGASLVAVECNATAATVAGCNTSVLDPITVSASGDVSSTFDVATGTVGNGTCGTSAADAKCVISIGTTSGTLVAFSLFSFASGPGVAVSPSTNLANGQSVTITGSDFTPADDVYAVECLETATSEAGCDTGTATPITVGSTGALPSTSFKVVTGTVGNGSCGTSATNYDGCVIEVANLSGGDAGAATIDFVAPSVTVAPAPKATRVDGSAVAGKTVVISVLGRNFTAGPKITGHAGTTVTVLSHSS